MILNRRLWKNFIHQTPRYGFFKPAEFDMHKDYYKILNCSPSDSENQIKQAYYKLAKQYHPDLNKGNEDKFKQINEAWEVLSDKHKKQQYDAARTYGSTNTQNYNQQSNNSQEAPYGFEEFIKKQGPNGSYQQYTYRSYGQQQKFSKEQMEEMQKQAEEFMKMFSNGQFNKFSNQFRQATQNDPRFRNMNRFMNMAEMAGEFYQQRQKSKMENEIKRQQNVENFANKEDKFKESLGNIASGIKGIWDSFTKK